MADEDNEEQIDSAEGESAKKEDGGGGGIIGPVLALLVVIALGVGIAFMAKSMLTETTDEGEDETEDVTAAPKGPLWEREVPIPMDEILANVKGERGRRYVKVDMQIWVAKEDELLIIGREDVVMPSLMAAVQDKLRSWSMKDYELDSQDDTMRFQFTEAMDKVLRELNDEANPERKYITRVVFNYLVQ